MSKNIFNFNLIMIFLIAYIVPTSLAPELLGLRIDVIIFIFVILINILYIAIINHKFNVWEIILMVFIFSRIIFFGDFRAVVLFSIVIAFRMSRAYRKNTKILNVKILRYLLFLSVIFTLLYTKLYWGYLDRYAYTTYGEPNISSLSIFLLSLIVMKFYKKSGILLILFGFLTFSRSYMLAVIIFIAVPYIIKAPFLRRIYNKLTKNFFWLMLIISILLIVVSNMFSILYEQNILTGSGVGLSRILNVLDFSNYLRFKVNTNLLDLYVQNPLNLITGFETKEFIKQSVALSRNKGLFMTGIKPHNFFYSYLQIYGGFAIVIMYYISKVLTSIISKDNFMIYLSIVSYVVFLGSGLNSYFLLLSTFTLMIYRKDENLCQAKLLL